MSHGSGQEPRYVLWSALIAGLAAIAAGLGSGWWVAQSSIEATQDIVDSNLRLRVADRRLDSYALLGTTVRNQLRELQLYRDRLGRDAPPDRDVGAVIGTAYRTVRSDAVNSELVADPRAAQMARCIVLGFLDLGGDLGELNEHVRTTIASGAGTDALDAEKDALKQELNELGEYTTHFIDYGAAHTYDDVREDHDATGVDPHCTWTHD